MHLRFLCFMKNHSLLILLCQGSLLAREPGIDYNDVETENHYKK